jgi:hypothetical protein
MVSNMTAEARLFCSYSDQRTCQSFGHQISPDLLGNEYDELNATRIGDKVTPS